MIRTCLIIRLHCQLLAYITHKHTQCAMDWVINVTNLNDDIRCGWIIIKHRHITTDTHAHFCLISSHVSFMQGTAVSIPWIFEIEGVLYPSVLVLFLCFLQLFNKPVIITSYAGVRNYVISRFQPSVVQLSNLTSNTLTITQIQRKQMTCNGLGKCRHNLCKGFYQQKQN